MLVLTHIRDRMLSHSHYTLVYAASLATEVECQLWEELEKHLDKLAKKFIDNATRELQENMARNVSKKVIGHVHDNMRFQMSMRK
ncbi:hypothetical protein WN944_025627 [Citrus x changshan-huyou]|uniref:Uncharacterized protein n=1 Tax=Citrus x changshan-huyou TaxID=2935761 RepID=A0AAP0QGU8_9ROSI